MQRGNHYYFPEHILADLVPKPSADLVLMPLASLVQKLMPDGIGYNATAENFRQKPKVPAPSLPRRVSGNSSSHPSGYIFTPKLRQKPLKADRSKSVGRSSIFHDFHGVAK